MGTSKQYNGDQSNITRRTVVNQDNTSMDEGQETLDRSIRDAESTQHQVRSNEKNVMYESTNE